MEPLFPITTRMRANAMRQAVENFTNQWLGAEVQIEVSDVNLKRVGLASHVIEDFKRTRAQARAQIVSFKYTIPLLEERYHELAAQADAEEEAEGDSTVEAEVEGSYTEPGVVS